MHAGTRRAAALAMVLVVTTACSTRTPPPHPLVSTRAPVAAVTTPVAAPVRMVPWHGPVENLFFHPLVETPSLAFTPDTLGVGFQDYFVTVHEFRGILDGLYARGWTLVDAHRVAAGRVQVPVGRRPFLLSEDDVNYYDYFAGRGLAQRLVLDPHGDVRAEFAGGRLSSDDLVPMVDQEVAAHPLFSAGGAKGVLGVTTYQGLFGEHDLSDPAARTHVAALAARLRSTGWLIASHTNGHIDLTHDSTATIERDAEKWAAATKGLLSPTDLLIYPFGARPSPAGMQLLRRHGFRVQFDIDIRPATYTFDGITLVHRRHVDGFAFQKPERLAPFFSVAAVRDPGRPD